MINRSLTISIPIVFTILNSFIWLVFGLIILFDTHPALPDIPFMKVGMAFLAISISVTLFVLGFFITRRSRIAFFLTSGLLVITSLLSIFDDFGMIDLAFLIINLIPLALLIKDRNWYLQSNSHTKDGNPKEM